MGCGCKGKSKANRMKRQVNNHRQSSTIVGGDVSAEKYLQELKNSRRRRR